MNPERFRSEFLLDWDLGDEWFKETGLPFIFALWVARDESFVTSDAQAALESSRDDGCRNIEEIIQKYSSDYGLTHQACREYLTYYLRFHVQDQELSGLSEFARRCKQLGIVK